MTEPRLLSSDQASALQCLGYLYLQHGQLGRGLALIILADRSRPGEITIQRTLAYAYLKNSEPRKALQVIQNLETSMGVIDPASPLQLLRAQALWLAGDKAQGRRIFQRFNQARLAKRMVADRSSGVPALEFDSPDDDQGDDDILVLGEGDRA